MSVIKASAIRDDFLKKPPNGIPIVLISPSSRVLRKIKEAEFKEFSLNQPLAEMLLEIPSEKRSGVVMEKIQKLLMEQGTAVLIKDFEMLFDPRYQIDVKAFATHKIFDEIEPIVSVYYDAWTNDNDIDPMLYCLLNYC